MHHPAGEALGVTVVSGTFYFSSMPLTHVVMPLAVIWDLHLPRLTWHTIIDVVCGRYM